MSIRVVLDTNVIFEGLTKQTGACGLIVGAWRAGLIMVCVTTTLLNEYEDRVGDSIMSEIVLQIPETLYNQLYLLAREEGVSLSQYVLYLLAHQASSGYRIVRVAPAEIEKQRQAYQELRERWGAAATDDEIDQLLAEREIAEPEPELTSELVAKVQALIDAARKAEPA
ncbi:MAG: PIN domain-containing protein [Caldilineaceae bacterium]